MIIKGMIANSYGKYEIWTQQQVSAAFMKTWKGLKEEKKIFDMAYVIVTKIIF